MRMFICLVFFIISLAAHAAGFSANSLTGIYSNIEYNEEGGDLLGVEIFLVRGGTTHYVLFQSAQGDPSTPILVPAMVKGNKLTFRLPDSGNGYSGSFEGNIFHDRLEGRFLEGQLTPSGKKEFILKRCRSYWQ